eukprot:6203924-Pleurochrysis_carterae.AAC.2
MSIGWRGRRWDLLRSTRVSRRVSLMEHSAGREHDSEGSQAIMQRGRLEERSCTQMGDWTTLIMNMKEAA